MEVFSGKMSSSDYRLRQFSNYSVKHQSRGLMQAVLWPDGQCNHRERAPPHPSSHTHTPHPSTNFTVLYVRVLPPSPHSITVTLPLLFPLILISLLNASRSVPSSPPVLLKSFYFATHHFRKRSMHARGWLTMVEPVVAAARQ